ncbi:MAG: hypothetical protein RL582_1570 [Bacteroidota bacterium]|jgi:hypothetical protein
MARKRNKVSVEELKSLRKEIEERIDFKIQFSKDCFRLAELIYRVTKSYISASTVRRIWGFEKSDFSFSYSTMDILRSFLETYRSLTASNHTMADFVLEFFQPLHFENISPDDKTFQASCRRIALLLRNDQSLFDAVYERLAQTDEGRQFYFELFPDYEFLLRGQSKGYEAYLNYSTTKSDKIFAHCILFFAAYLNGDNVKMIYHAELAADLFDDSVNLHPFVLGRFYFTQIVANLNNARGYWVLDAKKVEIEVCRNVQGFFREFPGFHYFVCDALRIAELWEDLLFFSSVALTEFPRFSEFEWKGYYQQLEMFNSIALYNKNEQAIALRMMKNIAPNSFYFISSGYFEGIFNFWKSKIHSSNKFLDI